MLLLLMMVMMIVMVVAMVVRMRMMRVMTMVIQNVATALSIGKTWSRMENSNHGIV